MSALNHYRKPLLLLLLLLALVALASAVTVAQDTGSMTLGTATLGSLGAAGTTASYSFAGNAGDLVTARVLDASGGMDPTLTLLGPAGEQLGFSDNAQLATTAAEITHRLLATGTYTLVVGGTPGDFLLTLELWPRVEPIVLTLDAPLDVVIPVPTPGQTYVFNTDPFNATTLYVDAEPFSLDATLEVRDGAGRLVGLLGGNLDSACLSFGPGDDVHEVRVAGPQQMTGAITLTLSNAPCELGAEPAPVVAVDQIAFEPATIDGVCAASTFNTLQVRLGPGLNYAVGTLLLARQPAQVVGVTEDGVWYEVQAPTFVGFIPASIVFLAGPCEQLPVVQPPAAPAAQTPTPGLPAVTPAATETVAATGTLTATASATVTGTTEPPAGEATTTPLPEVTATTDAPTTAPTVTPEEPAIVTNTPAPTPEATAAA